MHNPVDKVKGKITAIHTDGTIVIEAFYGDLSTLIKRDYKNVSVEFLDNRSISEKQRKMCWAMVNDIAAWQGDSSSATARELVNYARKMDFLINELQENAEQLFSLSNAPMSLVAAYQNYLIRFILEHDVSTRIPLYEYADDITEYVYQCLIHKKCAVCGKPADLHHIDAVGMGNNRKEIVHEGMECISLCREHHTAAHSMGNKDFIDMYHLNAGVKLDKTLCRIYKLKEARS